MTSSAYTSHRSLAGTYGLKTLLQLCVLNGIFLVQLTISVTLNLLCWLVCDLCCHSYRAEGSRSEFTSPAILLSGKRLEYYCCLNVVATPTGMHVEVIWKMEAVCGCKC